MSSVKKEKDPLLEDLSEKKERFRQSVVSLAAELQDLRHRLSAKEQYIAQQTLHTQEAEAKAKNMEKEMYRLQNSLEDREKALQASFCIADKHLEELDDLRSQLSIVQETADASATSAQIAQIQCSELAKELDMKNTSLKEHELRVNKLGEQLDLLQKDLQARELSQKQLKDEVSRVEHDIMVGLSKSGVNKGCELMKLLDEVSSTNFEKINRLLTLKDEEISKLRDENRIMSAHWNIKTKELESQLEKHKRSDQELKKRVLKLEFCLQEARAQTRKLQRMGERRDKALKELRDQLATKRPSEDSNSDKQFWESSGFKIMASMSMLVLVLFSKR